MRLLTKLWNNFQYSLWGLRAAFKRDLAFRIEAIALICFFPIPFIFSELSLAQKLLMLVTLIMPMIVELINSAIEVLCDTITKEYHQNIKFIKDAASAAVLLSVLTMVLTWGFNLWPLLF
jgi:diacylglycerol kinase (ATP)